MACLTEGEMDKSMYQVEGKSAYVDKESCKDKLYMYTLESGDTRLCVTK